MFSLHLVFLSASWPFKLLLTDRKHLFPPSLFFYGGIALIPMTKWVFRSSLRHIYLHDSVLLVAVALSDCGCALDLSIKTLRKVVLILVVVFKLE